MCFVRCIEVVRFSEDPLLEVPMYIDQATPSPPSEWMDQDTPRSTWTTEATPSQPWYDENGDREDSQDNDSNDSIPQQ